MIMPSQPPDLGIVIVNWNTRDLLRACLRSLSDSSEPKLPGFRLRVIVVDNASSDSSADMVRAEFPDVTVIDSPTNGGFAYGNNLGLRCLGLDGGRSTSEAPRYALLLNPDTLVPPGAIQAFVAYM